MRRSPRGGKSLKRGQVIFCILLVVILLNLLSTTPQVAITVELGEGQAYYQSPGGAYIDIFGVVWRKTTLVVLIRRTVSWSYVVAAADAFRTWSRAINAFANSYGYTYLSKIKFVITIEGVNGTPIPDITVSFADTSGDTKLGTATVAYTDSYITSASILIYLRRGSTRIASRDVFNIALHEIGHALGLDHAGSPRCSNGPEIMYSRYSWPGRRVTPTTLDLYALAVAYSWLKTGYFSPPSRKRVYLPAGMEYRLSLYYYVRVISDVGEVEGGGWYFYGSEATIRVLKTVIVEDGVRYVFEGWTGSVTSSKPTLTVRVTKDMTIVAKWKKQFRVEVVSPYSPANLTSGWYDEGAFLRVSVQSLVDYGNGTRRVLKGWLVNGEFLAAHVVNITVEEPITLEAVWELQYLVTVSSPYSTVRGGGWYPKGAKAVISVNETVVSLAPKSRAVFTGWSGDVESDEPAVEVVVNSPINVEALWSIEYMVEVVTEYGETNATSGWYREGTTLMVEVRPEAVYLADDVRVVFKGWLVNDTYTGPPLRVEVSGPLTIEAVWLEEYKVTFKLADNLGAPLPSLPLKIALKGPERAAVKGYEAWLQPGEWLIENVSWSNIEVEPKNPWIIVDRPGEITIPLKIYTSMVVVLGPAGLPVPGALLVSTGTEPSSFSVDSLGRRFPVYMTEGRRVVAVNVWGFKAGYNYVEAAPLVLVRSQVSPYGYLALIILTIIGLVFSGPKSLLGSSRISPNAQASS